MQIYAYIMHKNLAVHKIMEVMRTAYAKNGTRSQHVSNKACRKRLWNIYASMWKESMHHLQRTFYFAESFDQLCGKSA